MAELKLETRPIETLAIYPQRRVAKLMESDPHYCDVIIRRGQSLTGQKVIHEASGKTFDEVTANGC